jgi:hypothetical protein
MLFHINYTKDGYVSQIVDTEEKAIAIVDSAVASGAKWVSVLKLVEPELDDGFVLVSGWENKGKTFIKDTEYNVYVMFIKDGEIISEPYIPANEADGAGNDNALYVMKAHDCYDESGAQAQAYKIDKAFWTEAGLDKTAFDAVLVDYYVEHVDAGVQQIEITADKFGGNYYLEASTLFRDQRGVDMPAEFIIPNCKIQSNFNFTMASSGDPSTFTFTMDAFPDYTRFDRSKKVLAAIQIIKTADTGVDHRHTTGSEGLNLWA